MVLLCISSFFFFFFFNDTATTEIYTLSLHDALPISNYFSTMRIPRLSGREFNAGDTTTSTRSEEHTSELQSRRDLVCRLLLEKKNKKNDLIARGNTSTDHTALRPKPAMMEARKTIGG